jgi:hypothetical protein
MHAHTIKSSLRYKCLSSSFPGRGHHRRIAASTMSVSNPAIHKSAADGFGAAAISAYEHGRPEWELDHVRTLLDGMGVLSRPQSAGGSFPDLPLVEIGSGTGKFTRPLNALLRSKCTSGANPSLILVEPAGRSFTWLHHFKLMLTMTS